jgi:hypothetical protein
VARLGAVRVLTAVFPAKQKPRFLAFADSTTLCHHRPPRFWVEPGLFRLNRPGAWSISWAADELDLPIRHSPRRQPRKQDSASYPLGFRVLTRFRDDRILAMPGGVGTTAPKLRGTGESAQYRILLPQRTVRRVPDPPSMMPGSNAARQKRTVCSVEPRPLTRKAGSTDRSHRKVCGIGRKRLFHIDTKAFTGRCGVGLWPASLSRLVLRRAVFGPEPRNRLNTLGFPIVPGTERFALK